MVINITNLRMIKFFMSQIILFDIDKTIFGSNSLSQYFAVEVSKRAKMDIGKVTEIMSTYRSTLESYTDFNPTDFLNHFADSSKEDIDLLKKIFYNKRIYKQSLYPETKFILKKLKQNFKLGIFSEGFTDYQMSKLTNSEIIDFFNSEYIFIKRRKLNENVLNELPKNSIIIDDKEEVVEKLFSTQKFNPIWINRKDKRKKENIRTIKNLKELL